MSKVAFSNLKLKQNLNTVTVKFNDIEFQVLQYLPAEEKMALINVALQKANENGLFNPLKVNLYFCLNIVYLYTNISFTQKQREDEFKLYDLLEANGVIQAVLNAMDDAEYKILEYFLHGTIKKRELQNSSFYGFIEGIIQDLPKNAEAAAKIIENFDPNKVKEVMDFAKSVNNGILPG